MVMSGFAYAAGKFKDGHRKNDNWLGCEDVLILDIDDGCSFAQACTIFDKYEHFIITSRSHQKEKNMVVCDRFRIFIHLKETINDLVLRDKFIRRVMDIYYFVDKSTKDSGRFFYASPADAKVYYRAGIKMPLTVIETALQPIKEVNAINIPSENIYRLCELTEQWIDKNGNVLECQFDDDGLNIEGKLKGAMRVLDNEFYSGNRNHALFKTTTMLLNDGLNENDVANFILKENESRGGIPFKEVMAVIKSAIRTI
jgi:hypothetical protein